MGKAVPTRVKRTKILLYNFSYYYISRIKVFCFDRVKREGFMDKDKIAYFKDLLTKRLEGLLAEAGKTVEDMSDEEETFPDPTDRASLESDRNFLLRIRDRERKLILKIQEALDRIENGTFGICEMCGEEISEERLQARPVTTQCIDCKTEAEEKEKIGSH